VSHTGFTPAGLPSRWEPGTPHIIGAASLLSAFDYIDSIGGYEKIHEIEQDLIEYTWDSLERFTPYQTGTFHLVG
jgi:selenocysteine lyase/cysteine desulfurase